MSCGCPPHWLTSCILPLCGAVQPRLGCHLTTMFGSTSVMPIAVPKKKRSLLPLLTVVFLLSYGLMTMLIVEQGSVIQSQRNLIKVLVPESTELWVGKAKAIGDQQMAAQAQLKKHAQAPSTQEQAPVQAPSTKAPSTESPLFQAPTARKPSISAPQRHSQSRTGKVAKPDSDLPPVPAADLSDRRRALNTI